MPTIPQVFLNFKEFIFCTSHDLILSGRGVMVYIFEQSLNSSLHAQLMVSVTQVTVCEVIFQAVSNRVGFLWRMILKA
jgi:hypothetical protein